MGGCVDGEEEFVNQGLAREFADVAGEGVVRGSRGPAAGVVGCEW